MNNKNYIGQLILNFPITKIIIGLIACLSVGVLGQNGIEKLISGASLTDESKDLIGNFVFAFLVLVTYIILFKNYEKRKITELSIRKLGKNLILGILIGSILMSSIICVMYLNHDFSILSKHKLVSALPHMISVFLASIAAEILIIGVVFRIMEEQLGSFISLAIFVLIFGVIHSTIPNANLVNLFAIAIHAGLLLPAAYIYSRNLWFPIAIHFAWDFTQAGIFGSAVFGYKVSTSVFTTRIHGSALISGGYFGPHGSIQAALFCLIAAIIFIMINKRQNKIIKPFWKNNNKLIEQTG